MRNTTSAGRFHAKPHSALAAVKMRMDPAK
jgi:hypothetical protein